MKQSETSNGFRHSFSLRSGVHIHVANFRPEETIEKRFEIDVPWICFTFFLVGSGYWEWQPATGKSKKIRTTDFDRWSAVSHFPEVEGKICFPGCHRHFHLSISIRPSVLATYFNGCWELVPREFRDICEGYDSKVFLHRGPLSPVMDIAIHHLVECPYNGSMKKLYLESKAIELIAHKMAQIASAECSMQPLRLRHEDMERIHHAKDILALDLENPPGLFELARAVGTTHTKLNRGFREVFGTTVFGHLRNMRLEEAKQLLEAGGMNVTEAALSVGYDSISSFSRAFTTYFGRIPSDSKKKSG